MHPHVTFMHSVWEVSAMLAMVVWFIGRLLLTYRNWFGSKDQLFGNCCCILHEVFSGVIMVSCEYGFVHPTLPCVIYTCHVPYDIYSKYGPLRVIPRGTFQWVCLISGDIGQCYQLSCYLSFEGASYPTIFWYLVGCSNSHQPYVLPNPTATLMANDHTILYSIGQMVMHQGFGCTDGYQSYLTILYLNNYTHINMIIPHS